MTNSDILKKYGHHFPNIKVVNEEFTEIDSKYVLNKIDSNTPCISLLVGEVQSGKTNAILNLIFESFLNHDYKLIIFLCGINNGLKQQSINRIHDYKKFQDISQLKVVQVDSFKQQLTNINSKSKILLPVLKEDDNLNKIYDVLSNNIHLFINKKILIIDDESDYSSINTKHKDDKSKINDLITKIYKLTDYENMILLTATPYANILNSKARENEQANLIFTIKTKNEYTGINFFNNLNNFYKCDFKTLREINSFNGNETDLAICYSFFLWIYNTYLFFKNEPNEKSTLLIYTSNTKDQHIRAKNMVDDIVRNFDFYKQNFQSWLIKENKHLNNEELIKIEEMISNDLRDCVFILNNDHKNTVNEINDKKMSIVIGGHLLSRGITYENLLVELFLFSSTSPTCDTLLQRCRWFGYRRKNDRYKYMNLITTEKIKKLLFDAEKYNDILYKFSGRELDITEVYNDIYKLEQNLELKVICNDKK